MTHYVENKNCLVCESQSLFNYLDLTDQPLANSYHKGEKLENYPLQLAVCLSCWHSQLTVSVNPDEMFKHYLYISDTSKTLTDYFEKTTDYIMEKSPNAKSVLEIACNSGLLLEMFKNKGLECTGVDPAENIRELSEKRGLNVHVNYWNKEFSEKLKDEGKKYDLILAFHVLPHVPDPNEFLQSCIDVLSDDGQIFIQTSQCDMFLNNEFDVAYHEHSSYFTVSSIGELAVRNELYISSIVKTDIHGKSFLFSLTKNPCDEIQWLDMFYQEDEDGIHTEQKYIDFADNAEATKNNLLTKLEEFKSAGYTMIGYGAAAKGNTLLNYIKYKLDYIIDDNEMKEGYLTPGMDIPIHTIKLLENNFEKICFVPLAWNFYAEIKERVKTVRDTSNDVFVRYFPKYSEDRT